MKRMLWVLLKQKAEVDPGDHLHPNNAGYEAMANAVDLALFGAKPGKNAVRKKK
jgi:lysophospholipase L1-like esterase